MVQGQLDAWLPAMVHMCVQRLSLQTAAQQQAAANKKVRRPPRRLTARLLETISLCLYSNALVTLQARQPDRHPSLPPSLPRGTSHQPTD